MDDWTEEGGYGSLKLLRKGGAARIVLDRPEALNAWDKSLGDELIEVVDAVAADPAVRAVELRGAGKAFSSGADLKAGFDHQTPEGGPDLERSLHERYHPVILGIRRMPKPVLASVHGPAVGVSCSLALACDLVLATEGSYFLLAFANIGLVPDGGSSAFIPTRAGFSRATEMAMLAERIPGRRAFEWGLVNRLVADDEFDSASDELISRLAAGPTKAYAGIKEQLNSQCYPRLEEQLGLEASLQQRQATSSDFIEGVSAFLQRRDANFTGS